MLPEELKQRTRAYFQGLIAEGLRSAEEDGWVDGPSALERMRQELRARRSGGVSITFEDEDDPKLEIP